MSKPEIKPAPATDAEIAEYLELHRKGEDGYWNCDLDANVTVRQLIARIDRDSALIADLLAALEKLTDSSMDTLATGVPEGSLDSCIDAARAAIARATAEPKEE